MRKSVVFMFLLVASGVFAEPELLLHYQFDELNGLVSDSSGHGLDASCQQQGIGVLALAPASGVSGRADDYAYNGASADAMGDTSRGRLACRVMYRGSGLDHHYESFTICGWFKTEGDAPFSNNARLLSMVGTENVSLFDSVGNGMRFLIGSVYVESGSSAYAEANQWVFFAVTYDGSIDDGNNVTFWEGSKETLTLVRSTVIGKIGPWNGLGPDGVVSIGNRHGSIFGKHMNRPLDGYIDDFRIYASEAGSDGALSEAELDKIRQSVLSN